MTKESDFVSPRAVLTVPTMVTASVDVFTPDDEIRRDITQMAGVTPEMLEAGIDEYLSWYEEDIEVTPRFFVGRIFQAMTEAREQAAGERDELVASEETVATDEPSTVGDRQGAVRRRS